MKLEEAIKIVKDKCMFVPFISCIETENYFLFLQNQNDLDMPVTVSKKEKRIVVLRSPSEFGEIIEMYKL